MVDIPSHSEIYKILKSKSYELIAKTFNTLFFKDIKVERDRPVDAVQGALPTAGVLQK